MDLDSLPVRSLQLLQRETTLMSLSKHPNVLRVRGSWMSGHKLYIALRLMNKGSAADVMRYGWPGGMEQDVVRCILAQALKGLKYVPRLTYGLSFSVLVHQLSSYQWIHPPRHQSCQLAHRRRWNRSPWRFGSSRGPCRRYLRYQHHIFSFSFRTQHHVLCSIDTISNVNTFGQQ